jgi:hypothetical protein
MCILVLLTNFISELNIKCHIFKFNEQSAHEPKLKKVNWYSLIPSRKLAQKWSQLFEDDDFCLCLKEIRRD